MKKRGISGSSFWGGLILFLTVSVVVTVGILVYNSLEGLGKDGFFTTAMMLVVILSLSGICTIIDFIRRKYLVEKPTMKILEATEKIASGDFSVKLDITHSYGRYDEYDYIMENVNKMVGELSKTKMLHGDFVSNLSHEIKTPLASVKNYASLLAGENLTKEQREEYARSLSLAVDRITNLVTNILKLNKLENQQLSISFERVDLAEMLESAIISFESQIESKNITISCDIERLTAFSCKDMLEIVWNNLISNAVKFTDYGGNIFVSAKEQGEYIVVKVKDDGCGMSNEVGKRIFEKFYQGDTSHSSEGNGLGLALVKDVIDNIGGQIEVESELGKGSEFVVKIKKEGV